MEIPRKYHICRPPKSFSAVLPQLTVSTVQSSARHKINVQNNNNAIRKRQAHTTPQLLRTTYPGLIAETFTTRQAHIYIIMWRFSNAEADNLQVLYTEHDRVCASLDLESEIFFQRSECASDRQLRRYHLVYSLLHHEVSVNKSGRIGV